MNIVKRNKIIILLISLIAVCTVICSVLLINNQVHAWSFSGGQLEAVYYEGDEVVIPDGTFTVDGQTISASSSVIFPDGTTHNTKKLVISQYGVYKVSYFTQSGIEKFVEFTVDSPLYSVVGNGTAKYDKYTVKNEYWSNRDGEDRYEEINGVIASLGSGAKFVYNKTIDLKELTASQPLITFNIIAQKNGSPDFNILNIKVTDIYNPDTFLVLKAKDKQVEDADCVSYCFVGINDENTFYKGNVATEGKYGVSNVFSFRGLAGMRGTQPIYEDCTSIKDDTLSFYLSHEKNEVFRTDSRDVYSTVCKLDQTPTNWKGFTTGEVKIEVYAERYTSATADIIIRDIAGDTLGSSENKDTDAPEITIDFGDYEQQNIPFGKKGMEYKVFDAVAFDTVEGFIDTEVFVYRNYYSNTRLSVNLENGVFKTDQEGVYTICYTATDSYKNKEEKLVDVTVVDESHPISLEVVNYTTSAKQGETVSVKQPNVSGGLGEIKTEISVFKGEKAVELKNDTFVAMELGEYTVKYVSTDYVGQIEEFTHSINIVANDSPVLIEPLTNVLEKRYVAGYQYPVPEIKMYNFKTDGSYTEELATITIDNATISDNKFTPTEEGIITFNYSCLNKSYSETRPVYSIKNGKDLDLAKTFIVGENIEVSYNAENHAKYFVTDDSEMEFVNKLLADGFALSFNTEAGNNDIGCVNIYITDTENENQVVKFSFINDKGKTYFNINDGVSAEIALAFNGNQSKDFSVNLTEYTGEVIVDGEVFRISNYLGTNEKYTGFDSHKVYCKVEFKDVGEDGFTFIAKNVNGQYLRSTTVKDFISPVVIVLGEYERINQINTNFKLPEAIAGDVLSPYLKSFVVTVIGPDGKNVVSDGTTLKNVEVDQYEFTLSQYGKYTISYQAIDAGGQKNDGGIFAIYVYDLQPPTVSLQGEYDTEGKVGEKLTLATPVVTDNYATKGQITTYIMVKNPKGVLKIVEGNEFVPDMVGKYTIYVYAFDSNKDNDNGVSQGNVGSISYEIVVEG